MLGTQVPKGRKIGIDVGLVGCWSWMWKVGGMVEYLGYL